MKEVRTVINRSLPIFVFEIQELIQQGWEIDHNNPPTMWGVAYETGMTKTDKSNVQLLKAAPVAEVVKQTLTRAQILEKARAARGSNKTEQQHIG